MGTDLLKNGFGLRVGSLAAVLELRPAWVSHPGLKWHSRVPCTREKPCFPKVAPRAQVAVVRFSGPHSCGSWVPPTSNRSDKLLTPESAVRSGLHLTFDSSLSADRAGCPGTPLSLDFPSSSQSGGTCGRYKGSQILFFAAIIDTSQTTSIRDQLPIQCICSTAQPALRNWKRQPPSGADNHFVWISHNSSGSSLSCLHWTY